MKRLRLTSDGWVTFHCPGCKGSHGVPVNKSNPHAWGWNQSEELPTLTPSLLVNAGKANPQVPTCHFFVVDGKIQFLNDCTHELAGQTVEMGDVDA